MKQDPERVVDFGDWLGIKRAPNWTVARAIGPLIMILLSILFMLAFAAAFVVLLKLSFGGSQTTLGSGALVAAVLGSPFVVWGTVLKHRTVLFQKEGHMTDRINKAIEQLGAEKTVKRQLVNSSGKKVYHKTIEGELDYSRPAFVEESRPNIEVRLGAILSLERIAQDSTSHDTGRDHVRVMEILCAYIRENSEKPVECKLEEWRPLTPNLFANNDPDAAATLHTIHLQRISKRFRMTSGPSEAENWVESLPKLRIDIQLALTVIARRSSKQRAIEAAWPYDARELRMSPLDAKCPQFKKALDLNELRDSKAQETKREILEWVEALKKYSGYRLDLRGANLQGADFSSQRSDGSDAAFSGMLISGASLDGASFESAQLRGVSFENVTLIAANFNSADLSGASIQNRCNVEAATFARANLTGAFISEAQMSGVNLASATLDLATIDSSCFEAAWFNHTKAKFISLSSTSFFGVKSFWVDMPMASFHNTWHIDDLFVASNNFQGASFMNVDLSKVSNVDWGSADLFGDASVTLPQGTNRPRHWASIEIGWLDFDDEVDKWHKDPSGYVPPTAVL